ncbi:MAG: HNH endonuclease [Alphaproteobacteria bacterium]|nr:HNH endonuclease [Alphaproteobacteria bacterium]
MIQEIIGSDKPTFMLSSVLYKDRKTTAHKIKKLPRPELIDARYMYEMHGYENGKPIKVVQQMAEAGFFDGLMSNNAVRLAKKKGCLPEGMQVHHIVPLKLGGSNDIDNLCVVDAETHMLMHRLIYQPVLDRLEVNDEGVLILPEFKRVIVKDDREDFFLYSELRKFEESTRNFVTRHRRTNCNSDMGFRDAFCQSRSLNRGGC